MKDLFIRAKIGIPRSARNDGFIVMDKNLKLFLLGFWAAFSFFFAANLLQSRAEDLFLAREITEHPPAFFIAQIEGNHLKPKTIQQCPILAESALVVSTAERDRETIIFQKKESQKMPIASLTKLMTAIVASEFYHSSNRIEISAAAVKQEEGTGNLEIGEILQVQDLLAIMLIESSNDAAFALTQPMGVEGFTALMNLKAKDMGLENTHFFNPSGLEPDNPQDKKVNYSTAQDLVKISKYLIVEHPFLLDILSQKVYPLYFESGVLHHILKNTDELLGEIPEIIGGKTGWTERAGGCLILILKGKIPNTYFINVILNSPDRFEDMRKLINCTLW